MAPFLVAPRATNPYKVTTGSKTGMLQWVKFGDFLSGVSRCLKEHFILNLSDSSFHHASMEQKSALLLINGPE